MDGNKKDLEFKIFMQYKPNKEYCKKVINYVLAEYIKGNANSSDVDNYFSIISRFGYRLQKQRNNYYKMNIKNIENGLPLKDILNNLNIKSNYK